MTGGVAPGVINNLNHRVTNVENRMNHLDRKVDKLEKKANAGIAGATAIASIPQVMQGGKSMIASAPALMKANPPSPSAGHAPPITAKP